MAQPETLCPSCGFSPIAEGAEKCPKCGKAFSYERVEYTNVTATRAGGLTGSVTANPVPTAVALGLGAFFFTVRAGGFLGDVGDPPLVFAVAALDVVALVLVMTTSGPAKHVAAFAGLVELAAAGLTFGAPALVNAAAGLHGLTLIAMTVAEPGARRLKVGGALASFAAVAGLGALAGGVMPKPEVREVLREDAAGLMLTLPPGWKAAREGEVAPHLVLAWDGGKTINRGFRLESPRQVGVVILSRDEQPDLEKACRDTLATLGVTGQLTKVDGPAPPSLGEVSSVSELRTKSGATGRFGCALVGTKLVALAVVSQDPAPGVGAAAFELVAAGLAVEP
ncbi:MAG: zinc ribbon domain-containing protein [Myxococcales bacterium]|nr:zinc ribbon domain-containing protein [Myxococcales bacterium]